VLVLLDTGQGVIQDDRVSFELEVVETLLDVDRGHRRIVGDQRRVDSGQMVTSATAPIRYLAAADVLAAMPDLDERLRLAWRTMTALVSEAELPRRSPSTLARTDRSPMRCRPICEAPTRPAATISVGLKWVAGYGGNRALGLAAIHAVIVLNDPATGVPTAILDGGPVTALRTAAVSGVAIRAFARPSRVARSAPD